MLRELKATLEQCDRDGKDRSEYLQSHLFFGNPGTGETTVARAMAQILSELGVLETDKIVTCSALDLQGSYVGQMKDKVNEKMVEAQGGRGGGGFLLTRRTLIEVAQAAGRSRQRRSTSS